MHLRRLRQFSVLTTVGLFLVAVMGFLVTDTGSGTGCGHSWPLCHGRFIPAIAIHTLIEFSHRAVSGIVGVLVLLLAVWAWRAAGRRLEVRLFALVTLLAVVVQALLGAAAVLWPQPATVLALHFGVSLIAYAGAFLLTALLYQLDRPAPRGSWRSARPPAGVTRLAWATLVFTYVVVYVGAFVAHSGSGLACAGWPLCNGALVPVLAGRVAVNFIHRLLAVLLAAVIVRLFLAVRPLKVERPDLYRAAHISAALVVLQIASGAYLSLSHLDLVANLTHVSLMTVLFGTLAYLAVETLPEPAGVPRAAGAVDKA